MINRKALKSKSKEQLRGQWKMPVLVTLSIIIIQLISSYAIEIFIDDMPVYILLFILNLLITLSLGIMINSFYLKISRDKNIKFSDIFIPWRTYGKGIGIELLIMLIFIPIIVIITIIVGVISALYMNSTMTNALLGTTSVSFGNMIVVMTISMLVLCIPLVILELYFFPAVILVCEDNNRGVIQCIKESFKLMKGKAWSLFVLNLSFIGWVILCIIPVIVVAILIGFSSNETAIKILPTIAGFGFLWLAPYIRTTLLNFFNEISGYTNNPLYNEIHSLN